jgi:DNA-binding CsgD family transcriptional regulator
MRSEIVGREEELASARSFLDPTNDGLDGLVLEGAPGIGKSTLWVAVVEEARARGFRVLTSRPAEAERTLAYAGLGDLFDGTLHDVLPALTAPRRRALESVLLLDEPDEAVDDRAVAVAVRDALQTLDADASLLVAVDDVQWLDRASSRALEFALRRLAGGRIRVLLAMRPPAGGHLAPLATALESDRVVRQRVGPLSVGALHHLLRDRVGRVFARQTLLRIHDQSSGNPFFAIEIGRALGETVDTLRPLPVPQTLDDLLRARIDEVPAETRRALELASALGPCSPSLLVRAGVDADTLAPALAARLIEHDEDLIRFTHPLLASIVYEDLGGRRAAIHRKLAQVVDDQLLRARHRALSADAPDARLAKTLEQDAHLARNRGSSTLAAELAEHALRLTDSGDAATHARRALGAARAQLAAGEWTRARALAAEVAAEAPPGALRAEGLLLQAEFAHDDLAVPFLERALLEPLLEPALELRIRLSLAWAVRFRKGFAVALGDTRAAVALADGLGNAELQVAAIDQACVLGEAVGDREIGTYAARAGDVAAAAGDERLLREAHAMSATALADRGDLGAARLVLERVHEEWRDRDELFAADILGSLAWLELWAGRWELGAGYAQRTLDTNLQYGVERNQDHIASAWIALHRGQLELALAEAKRGLELCEKHIGFHAPLLESVPGIVALWRGDLATAAGHLGDAERRASTLGWRSANRRPWTGEHVEALLGLGRVDEAASLVDAWEADAVRLAHVRVLAHVTRCRGLVAAAEGAVEEAQSLLAQAAEQHRAVGDVFGHARASFALGIASRRARQKRAAREALDEALQQFERLGAHTWVERAHEELAAIGGRSREDGLTAAERRVAALVVVGRTNKEVAAALSLAERSVAGHLTHIYAKLGVRSRTELARRLR